MAKMAYMVYYNFKCRKCGKIIALFTEYNNTPVKGAMMPNTIHSHCEAGIQDGEYIYADLVSYSQDPIPDTVECLNSHKQHIEFPVKLAHGHTMTNEVEDNEE